MFCLGCVQVSVIDNGLLKFSKLEELVLSANKITEIPADNLPSMLNASQLLCTLSDFVKFNHCKSLSVKGN